MVQIAAEAGLRTSCVDGPRAQDRRREILRAAARVFRSRGLHAAGMRDIAAEAGMHAGNLYYYFQSKEELLAYCQRDALDGLAELVAEVRASGAPPDERLRTLIAGHVELLNERTPGSLAHLEVEALSEEWRSELQARRDRYERSIRTLVREAIDSGAFRQVDPAAAALAILGAANWTVKWFRDSGSKSAREVGLEFADLLVGGLASDTGNLVEAKR